LTFANPFLLITTVILQLPGQKLQKIRPIAHVFKIAVVLKTVVSEPKGVHEGYDQGPCKIHLHLQLRFCVFFNVCVWVYWVCELCL